MPDALSYAIIIRSRTKCLFDDTIMSAKMEADGHHQKLQTHSELRADGGLTPSSAHFQGLISASATNMFKQVIDEIKPARGVEQNR